MSDGPVIDVDLPGKASPRRGEPLSCGVPWPRGGLRDAERLELRDDLGRRLALQSRVLDRWSDGSVRWTLLDWRAELPLRSRYFVSAGPSVDPVAPDVSITTSAPSAGGVRVCSGPLAVELDRGGSFPFDRALSGSGEVLLESGSIALDAEDDSGVRYATRTDRIELEEPGPLRASVRVWGALIDQKGHSLADLVARIELFAGSPVLRCQLTVRNPRPAGHPGGRWSLGNAGSVYLRDLSLRIAPAPPPHGGRISCSPVPGALCTPVASPLELYQDSSGGDQWNSRNHLNRHRELPLRQRGYRLRETDRETQGLRASPILRVEGTSGEVALTLRHFWQNFPKAIGAADDGMVLGLFPRQHADVHELQGGEQKTHCFALALGRDAISDPPLDWCRLPAVPVVGPEWHAHCQSVPHLVPESDDPHRVYVEFARAAIEGADSFEAKRERIDEYGWRHFGDIWADHEAVNAEKPLASHYNNQYDAIHGFAVQLFRSGDARWYTALEELARHVVDIDIYHTDGDRSAYNHGMFWHTVHYTDADLATHRSYPVASGGGGPSGGHLYTTGLMLYYFLTGDPTARETVLELGQYVIDADDGDRTVLRYLARGETGHISGSGVDEFHGPGRSPANSLNALLDALRVSGDDRFLAKAERLIERTIHPRDDLEAFDLRNVERRWYYTMFLQSLGRYLEVKAERGELDAGFCYARQALLHYATWAAENERPYLDRPEILEYPTETWAAQDLRKCELLQIAALHAAEPRRSWLLERAHWFHDTALHELGQRPTRTLCRPVVLLLSNGYTRAFFERELPAAPSDDEELGAELRSPFRFVPQKVRAKRRLLAALVCGGLCLGLLLAAATSRW